MPECSHVFVKGAKKGIKCNANTTNDLMCSAHKKCEHGRRRQRCRDCGGASICQHGRERSACKDCGGTSVCEHSRQRSKCKDCHGASVCQHSRQRSKCRDCGGASICQHSRRRWECKDCGGSQICEHSRVRNTCKECKGISICEHSRRRSACKECHGSQICEHSRRRSDCHICDPPIHPKNWCQSCKYVRLTVEHYKPYCFTCYCVMFPDKPVQRRYKTKEHHMRDALISRLPDQEVSLVFDKRIDGGCSYRRPDVRIEMYTHTIIIECDEFQHASYSCENKRIMEIFQDLGSRPIVFIRFNPDSYKKDGKTVTGCFKKTGTADNSVQTTEWNKRLDVLEKEIKKHLKKIPSKEVTEIKLFFNS